MRRLLTVALATLVAATLLTAASTAPEARGRSCQTKLSVCYSACDRSCSLAICTRRCDRGCDNAFLKCWEKLHPQAKANDPPKNGIDGTSSGTWVPNSPTKGKGIPSVPAGGTWNPSPNSGAKGTILRSNGGRR
jgi:hypothetical protein